MIMGNSYSYYYAIPILHNKYTQHLWHLAHALHRAGNLMLCALAAVRHEGDQPPDPTLVLFVSSNAVYLWRSTAGEILISRIMTALTSQTLNCSSAKRRPASPIDTSKR